MSKRRKPQRGPSYPITKPWVEDAEAKIEELGITKRDLAARLNKVHGDEFCTESSIGNVLNRKYPTSHLVPAISDELKIRYSVSIGSDDLDAWNAVGEALKRIGLLDEYFQKVKAAEKLEREKRELFQSNPDNDSEQ